MTELSSTPSRAKIAYILKSDCGKTLDQVDSQKGLNVDLESDVLPLALREAIKAHKKGDVFEMALTPDQAYGQRDEDLVTKVDRSQFAGIDNLRPGMQLEAKIDGDVELVWIRELSDQEAVIDLNHPLAGISLIFQVELLDTDSESAILN